MMWGCPIEVQDFLAAQNNPGSDERVLVMSPENMLLSTARAVPAGPAPRKPSRGGENP